MDRSVPTDAVRQQSGRYYEDLTEEITRPSKSFTDTSPVYAPVPRTELFFVEPTASRHEANGRSGQSSRQNAVTRSDAPGQKTDIEPDTPMKETGNNEYELPTTREGRKAYRTKRKFDLKDKRHELQKEILNNNAVLVRAMVFYYALPAGGVIYTFKQFTLTTGSIGVAGIGILTLLAYSVRQWLRR